MSELKPCPFCGGEAKLRPCGREWYVECSSHPLVCYCQPWTGYFDTAEHAIEVWNQRTPEGVKVETNFYDKEEIFPDCTVQVLTNTATGETSVGWWKNG